TGGRAGGGVARQRGLRGGGDQRGGVGGGAADRERRPVPGLAGTPQPAARRRVRGGRAGHGRPGGPAAVRGVVRDCAAGLRMAVGTLTAIPVRVRRVDRTVAAWAMAAAPLVGVLLTALAGAVLAGALLLGLSPLLAAVLAVGALALLTRGLHLDGLADVADGLGSGAAADRALEVMRRSDIGPFGVVTLVLVVLVQVASLAELAAEGTAAALWGLGAALLSGRLAVTWAC